MIIFHPSGPAGDLQQSSSPPHRFRFPEAHQLSTSFSTAGGAVGGDGWTLAEQRYWEVTFIIQNKGMHDWWLCSCSLNEIGC